MRPLNATELLNAWERGLNQPILERALILVTTASPELDAEEAAKLSIGERDARLLQLREWMFGTRLLNTARCPQCGEKVEWEGSTTDLHIQAIGNFEPAQEFTLDADGYKLRFHLPGSSDIAAAVAAAPQGGDNNAAALMEQCIVSIEHAGKNCDFSELPSHALDALSQYIEQLDPQAEIRTRLVCPECSREWELLFDIATFLWAEINSWAERTIRTIHRLASAYGWTESEILNLSPLRRQLYLGMVNR